MSLVLHDHQLRDADARQLQRPAIAGRHGEVTADDASGHLRRLDGDLQPVRTGSCKGLQGGAVGMLGPDGDIDAGDTRAVEQ